MYSCLIVFDDQGYHCTELIERLISFVLDNIVEISLYYPSVLSDCSEFVSLLPRQWTSSRHSPSISSERSSELTSDSVVDLMEDVYRRMRSLRKRLDRVHLLSSQLSSRFLSLHDLLSVESRQRLIVSAISVSCPDRVQRLRGRCAASLRSSEPPLAAIQCGDSALDAAAVARRAARRKRCKRRKRRKRRAEAKATCEKSVRNTARAASHRPGREGQRRACRGEGRRLRRGAKGEDRSGLLDPSEDGERLRRPRRRPGQHAGHR